MNTNHQLDGFIKQDCEFTELFRAVCNDEYESIVKNNKFIYFPYAMEMKWFATSYEHAKIWADSLYPDDTYKIIKVTIPLLQIRNMFFCKSLDGIGPAFAADVGLLNEIAKKVELI